MRVLVCLLLCFNIHFLHAQKLNKVLDRLLAKDVPDGTCIRTYPEDQLDLGNEYYERKNHMYVRWNGNLYLVLGGTGHVLKLEKDSDSSFTYTKIDSTIFNGNNFGSFSFVSDSLLYNFGGYGHWRHNGQLRRYNDQAHEWDIMVLNEEIAFQHSISKSFAFTNFPNNNHLYITERIVGSQYTREKQNKLDELWSLDIKKGNWEKLGDINPIFKEANNHYFTHILTSKIGTIIGYGTDFYLYRQDYPTLLKLKKSSNLGVFFYKTFGGVSFCIDSTIYNGYFNFNTLDSAKISITDFEETDIQLYVDSDNRYYLILIPIALSITMISIFYFKRKKRAHALSKEENEPVGNSLEAFDEKELIVLNTILYNSERGLDTFIEQINQVLGIEKKNIAIQKRQRSDILISINTKLSLLLETSDLLIQKKRLEFDKRSFCYFIAIEDINKVKALITK
jgi:hypothetical protein